MARRITCITKNSGDSENPYTEISNLGYSENGSANSDFNATRLEMYNFVKGNGLAYVKDSKGEIAYLIAAESPRGTKYVKTKADTTTADNLLSLPKCS